MVNEESLETSPKVLQSFSVRFGPFRLEPAERRLLCDDVQVPLTPKAFDVLLMLVEHAGHLVKKEDVMARAAVTPCVARSARSIYDRQPAQCMSRTRKSR